MFMNNVALRYHTQWKYNEMSPSPPFNGKCRCHKRKSQFWSLHSCFWWLNARNILHVSPYGVLKGKKVNTRHWRCSGGWGTHVTAVRMDDCTRCQIEDKTPLVSTHKNEWKREGTGKSAQSPEAERPRALNGSRREGSKEHHANTQRHRERKYKLQQQAWWSYS